jgi:hypothetical protein
MLGAAIHPGDTETTIAWDLLAPLVVGSERSGERPCVAAPDQRV